MTTDDGELHDLDAVELADGTPDALEDRTDLGPESGVDDGELHDLADPDAAFGERNRDDETAGIVRSTMEWVVVIVGAILLALFVRTFVAQAFSIPSGSMETTLLVGDHVVVDKLGYRLGEIDRFDVVVLDTPPNLDSPYDELIKRVVGLPGETVSGANGQVLIDGVPLDEPHLDPDAVIRDFPAEVVPEGHVFLMGDNRGSSADSRVFGPVPIDTIVGQARAIYWPFSRLGGL